MICIIIEFHIMKNLREIFDYFDQDKKEHLTPHQLRCALIYITGNKPSKIYMNRLKEQYSKTFTFPDFVGIVKMQETPDRALEILQALDLQNEGFINWNVFNELCDSYIPHTPQNVRTSVFSEVDSNGDGRVTLKDIEKLVSFKSD
ncbi:unnamed protein product [Blepharisma stoltei]|uniref:EF-hand domain-containing protein n=1 Tax=Blepharisma stoltei TaxID=1481888 RepID=A0AAU9J6D9_9CILI|nr:unnamed protein product [Blepharisma stoltei]